MANQVLRDVVPVSALTSPSTSLTPSIEGVVAPQLSLVALRTSARLVPRLQTLSPRLPGPLPHVLHVPLRPPRPANTASPVTLPLSPCCVLLHCTYHSLTGWCGPFYGLVSLVRM